MLAPTTSRSSQSRSPALLLATCLALAACASAGGTRLTQEEEAGKAAAQDSSTERAEDPEQEPFEALGPICDRMEQGDLEEARALLEELLAPGIEPLIEGAPEEVADAWLQELDEVCGELDLLEPLLAVREAIHQRLAERWPEDHPDLLAAKLNLAATRHQLGDLEGALALFEHVHAALERSLPEDHPDLLAAKQNLAVTRWQLGDLEGRSRSQSMSTRHGSDCFPRTTQTFSGPRLTWR